MDPSKPNDPAVDQGQPIPRSRPAENEVLEGEVIDRGVPIGRPSPPPPPPKKPGRTRRTVLWTLLGIAVFICLGGLGAGYIYYDKATAPNTETPGRALEEFVDERLHDGSPERLQRLTCSSPTLREFDDFVSWKAAREAETNEEIEVVVSATGVRFVSDDKAEIETELVLSAGPRTRAETVGERWHFDLVREDGWRVCGAHRLQ